MMLHFGCPRRGVVLFDGALFQLLDVVGGLQRAVEMFHPSK